MTTVSDDVAVCRGAWEGIMRPCHFWINVHVTKALRDAQSDRHWSRNRNRATESFWMQQKNWRAVHRAANLLLGARGTHGRCDLGSRGPHSKCKATHRARVGSRDWRRIGGTNSAKNKLQNFLRNILVLEMHRTDLVDRCMEFSFVYRFFNHVKRTNV